ncbi:hypothetical protein WQE_35625, partial [Paraburkholderia hospita]
ADNRFGDAVRTQHADPGEDLASEKKNKGSGHQHFQCVEAHDVLLQLSDRSVIQTTGVAALRSMHT